ncbi:MAG: alpha/beta fold hydrolase [Bacteroidales bacterium]|nr:alpha/beta fold hydrolase [Bacteroidales bacterium]MDZ4204578.1 alpha/beta fold hydrolase [Bacteroidales bacterium]
MELFFRKYGTGQPVIILHGLFGISDNWVAHAKRLAKEYEVFIPDQRNHGHSPHSSTFNYYALTEDLLGFMNQNQLTKAILIGHSMGGKVAMNFALEYPFMVPKLVVVDISPRAYPVSSIHQNIIAAMNSVDFDQALSRGEVEEILQAHISNRRIRLFILKNLFRKNRNMFGWRINTAGITINIDDISAGLNHEGAYPGPTLFVKGADSDYITDEDEPLIFKYFPNATIETIEGASHWVHADAPDELCRLFSSFLGKECAFEPQALGL